MSSMSSSRERLKAMWEPPVRGEVVHMCLDWGWQVDLSHSTQVGATDSVYYRVVRLESTDSIVESRLTWLPTEKIPVD